jgi:hypothetical protein
MVFASAPSNKKRRPYQGRLPVNRFPLKMESELRSKRPRRDVVGPAKRGEEVVQRIFVGYVNGGQLQTHFVLIAVKHIVMSDS